MEQIKLLSEKLGKALIQRDFTITTAESCTGGAISAAITEVAGSSAYFERAFVTYSNQAKCELVGVDEIILSEFGAVSQQTVEQMARGAALAANANIAIAVSGIAGPTGGYKDKPVGTVWLAIYCTDLNKNNKTTVWAHCFYFAGDRSSIRNQAVEAALIKALDIVSKKK